MGHLIISIMQAVLLVWASTASNPIPCSKKVGQSARTTNFGIIDQDKLVVQDDHVREKWGGGGGGGAPLRVDWYATIE